MNKEKTLELIQADIEYGTNHQRAKDIKIWSEDFKHGYDTGYYDCLKSIKRKVMEL